MDYETYLNSLRYPDTKRVRGVAAALLDALEEMEDAFGYTMEQRVKRGDAPDDAGGWIAVQKARAAILSARGL